MNKWNKNTINLEEFKTSKIAVLCNTKEKARDLFAYLDSKGITWIKGDDLLDNILYNAYTNDTCYIYYNGLRYSPLDFFVDRRYKIIEWEIIDENREEPKCIIFDEINRNTFKKKIYVSHGYGGKQENIKDVENKVKQLIKEYPDYLFISPIHCFGYLYESITYEAGIDACLELLKMCDEIWILDNKYQESKGVMIEREYALSNNIPIYLVKF